MIELSDVSKTYLREAKPVEALRGVNLTVEAGEWLAVQGPSGSGKSTLLSLMAGLTLPGTGQVTISGATFNEMSTLQRAAFRREHIGFVFQLFHLVPYLSVLDNICLGAERKADVVTRARSLASRLDLEARLAHRPGRLSVGERQRTALARALISDPSIILADEPTGNLDSALAQRVLDDLRELSDQGKTIVLVTHDSAAAQRADRTIELVDGVVA